MLSGSIIKADPNDSTSIEFDISIEGAGIKRKSSAIVRLVIHDKDSGDRVFNCKNTEGSLWAVTIPAIKEFANNTLKYTVEVIVDGYFFEPADGEMMFSADPKVVAEVKPASKKEVVKEASGGGEVTGQYAPTNDLLKPEYEPPSSHAKAPGTEKDDENIDMSRLSDLGRPVPGPGTDPEPEGSDTVKIVTGFNPRDIAKNIIKDKMGSVKAPEKKGTLFKRGADGKPIVDGIVTPEQERLRKEKSARVKEILKTT